MINRIVENLYEVLLQKPLPYLELTQRSLQNIEFQWRSVEPGTMLLMERLRASAMAESQFWEPILFTEATTNCFTLLVLEANTWTMTMKRL